MADKRIDQLTEAESIADEDLFVIWKQNISQTRSIAKGTMNLATKSYVDGKIPNYSNATSLTISQFPYTAPTNGVIMMSVNSSSQATGGVGDRKVYVNNVEIANIIASVQGVGARPTDLYIPLFEDDIVSFSNNNADVNIRSAHFMPFRT